MPKLTKAKNSISFHLLKTVFLIYFTIAFTLTSGQLLFEYNNIKNQVSRDLVLTQQSFSSGLLTAVYDINDLQLESIIEGMVVLPSITGAQIEIIDTEFNSIVAKGTIIRKDGSQVLITNTSIEENTDKLFWHDFSLYKLHSDDKLASGRIYSSESVVFEQVKDVFFIVIMNAILKTSALWFIFLWAAKSRLTKPITVLTHVMKNYDLEHPEKNKIEINTQKNSKKTEIKFNSPNLNEIIQVNTNDEIHLLTFSFNELNQALIKKIKNIEIISELAEHLSKTRKIDDILKCFFSHIEDKYPLSTGAATLKIDNKRLIYFQYPPTDTSDISDEQSNKPELFSSISGTTLFYDYVKNKITLLLIIQNEVIGVIHLFVKEKLSISVEEQLFLDMMSRVLVNAITNNKLDLMIEQDKLLLEQRVQERTKELTIAKENTETALHQLHEVQKTLIAQEKMAVLGGMVVGVAHEMNTPLGIILTASSFLEDDIKSISDMLNQNQLTKDSIVSFLATEAEICNLLLTNTKRAIALIKSFKLVATGQSSKQISVFFLKEHIESILVSLAPEIKITQHHITIDVSDQLKLTSYPEAFSQIFTNLINNSLVHGFENIESGCIHINAIIKDNSLEIRYTDNGIGMSESHVKKVFDPFFTTKRGYGGIGLGMNIVYNHVTQLLQGTVSCCSELGSGTTILINIPYSQVKSTALTE